MKLNDLKNQDKKFKKFELKQVNTFVPKNLIKLESQNNPNIDLWKTIPDQDVANNFSNSESNSEEPVVLGHETTFVGDHLKSQ